MKIKVAVLFGGDSVEHEVSIISAIQAMNACNQEKYDVVPLYISKDREFYAFKEIPTADQFSSFENIMKAQQKVTLVKDKNKVILKPEKKSLFQSEPITIDIAIPVMHGTNGEDGTIQGVLEMLKIPYAGCDVVSAACGQDKVMMKHILENSGIPICPWTWIYAHRYNQEENEILNKIKKIGYPVIVKPACLGSSIGIEIAHNDEELKEAIKESSQYDNKIVIEAMVENLREVNCSVLGDIFDCRASVLEEVGCSDGEFLDYKAKYLGGSKGSAKGVKNAGFKMDSTKTGGSKSAGMASTARIVPAPIDDKSTQIIQSLAVKTFNVIGASGVCRIDFMINDHTGKIYVNEINTIPGSLAFYLWQEEGVDFTALMDKLINQAIQRQRRREKMITSFDTNILENFHG